MCIRLGLGGFPVGLGQGSDSTRTTPPPPPPFWASPVSALPKWSQLPSGFRPFFFLPFFGKGPDSFKLQSTKIGCPIFSRGNPLGHLSSRPRPRLPPLPSPVAASPPHPVRFAASPPLRTRRWCGARWRTRATTTAWAPRRHRPPSSPCASEGSDVLSGGSRECGGRRRSQHGFHPPKVGGGLPGLLGLMLPSRVGQRQNCINHRNGVQSKPDGWVVFVFVFCFLVGYFFFVWFHEIQRVP